MVVREASGPIFKTILASQGVGGGTVGRLVNSSEKASYFLIPIMQDGSW